MRIGVSATSHPSNSKRPLLTVIFVLLVVLGIFGFYAAGNSAATSVTSTTKPMPSGIYSGAPAPGQIVPPAPADVPLPASYAAGTCGNWSLATNPNIAAMVQSHGEIRNCLEVGNDWVMLFVAGPSPADVAVLQCAASDSGCQTGASDLSGLTWDWLTPPTSPQPSSQYAYAASLIEVNSSSHTLLIDANGSVLTLNPSTETFTPETQG
jgi:hypothetical protein